MDISKLERKKLDSPMSSYCKSNRQPRKSVGARNYDENLIDELIDKHLGVEPRKKCKTMDDLEKETETEAMIALSLGFPIDALLEEEIEAGVVSELSGVELNNYIVVRNHILAKWRDNVHAWLSIGQIRETVSKDHESLICAAYNFLTSRGYINFGVLPSINSHILTETTEGTVIIVGSGLAGLAAARQLLNFGFKVVILEGRLRPGGRVYTQKIGHDGAFAAVDLGGSVITGIHANPLGVLARQLSLPLHKVRDKCPLYRPDGLPVDKEIDTKVETMFNKLLDKATQLRQIIGEFANNISLGSAVETFRQFYGVARSGDERQLLDWHLANLEYANAGQLSMLSLAYWDQDDPYEMGGDHCLLAGGNCKLIDALCKGVPIFYGRTVHAITYGKEGVEVTAGEQVFQADMALCTVPLGVLKKKIIKFEPELPTRKVEAINRLGYGLLNKIALVFPRVFWEEDEDTFGSLNKDHRNRGEFFLFYSYHMVSGGPVLVALVAGESALSFEQSDPADLLNRVLSVLRGIYSSRGIDVPNPIQSICTRWGGDSLCYGSYSHVGIGSSGADYDILAESVGNSRLFFAGEATNRQYPATMHGAFLSGLREASHILNATKSKRGDSRKSVQKNTGAFNDTLSLLFRTPDLAFGKFSYVFDPSSEGPQCMGLMRVIMGKSPCNTIEKFHSRLKVVDLHEASKVELHLYAIISREQAYKLESVKGTDKNKLFALSESLGLKLVASSSLGPFGNRLVANIVRARRVRDKSQTSAYQEDSH